MPVSLEILLPFFTASLLLALAPGPDNIFVLTQSALHGRIAGLMVMAGLCTGLIGHSAAVAFGAAVIFQTSATAFSLLKCIGGAYLIWLAIQAFRASGTDVPIHQENRPGLFRLYCRGIIMNVTNPKVAIFFLAFLPQFVSPAGGSVSSQILVLGLLFILATLLVFGSIALTAGTLGQWMNRSERIQKTLNRLAGTVFIGLALMLVRSER
ncbi:LysE family translocator [Desulfobotulus sp. H1]|uniref:LysE family translocator n=1 Tax=Desulfobotulus pelophilus TaxID=2823377 RepID=A0ABT3N9J5_9BACT|nr:LysE family translocator [Desulfobotulus pelophilus]MCW7754110.1 LysE family translocator [Desulfobotulus pelophilus]